MKLDILLVGKSEYLEMIFSNLFHNHRVYYSHTFADALSILQNNPVDILIIQFEPLSLRFIKEVFSKYPDIYLLLLLNKSDVKKAISEMEDILFEYAEIPFCWEEIDQKLKLIFKMCRLRKINHKLNLFNIMTPYVIEAIKRDSLDNLYKAVVDYLENTYRNTISMICEYKEKNFFIIKEVGKKGEYFLNRVGYKKGSTLEISQQEIDLFLKKEKIYIQDSSSNLFIELKKEGFKKSLLFPLILDDKLYGLFVFMYLEESDIETEDINLFKQLASKLSLIIDHIELSKEINKLSKDLKKSQDIIMHQQRLKILGQMASGISHDLNNLVFPIIGFAELLLERETGISKQGRRYLYQILQAAEDIKNIIDRLRQFYKKREDIESELEWIDLNEVVKEVIELTEAKWKKGSIEKGINIEIECSLSPDIKKVRGVKSEIREALVNLIFNAVDALPQGGKITISTWMDKEAVKLSVKDNGIGMDKESLEHCLDPFYTTKGEKGTGLGLSIIYGIMNRHRGKVEVLSEQGKGTEVILTFPYISEESKEKEEKEEKRSKLDILKPLKILYIDDELSAISLVRDILSADNHLVIVANDGETGVKLFADSKKAGELFDVVITDFVMPKMDGVKVAATVKSISPDTPVILLTGWDLPKGKLGDYVDLLLKKPIFPSELKSAISQVLSKKIKRKRS